MATSSLQVWNFESVSFKYHSKSNYIRPSRTKAKIISRSFECAPPTKNKERIVTTVQPQWRPLSKKCKSRTIQRANGPITRDPQELKRTAFKSHRNYFSKFLYTFPAIIDFLLPSRTDLLTLQHPTRFLLFFSAYLFWFLIASLCLLACLPAYLLSNQAAI